jgi:omega-6 fatty acid desaturase (delta-12 desaturase)
MRVNKGRRMALDVKSASSQINRESDWKKIVKPYQTADTRQSMWQLVNTFGPLVVCWILAYLSLSVSY